MVEEHLKQMEGVQQFQQDLIGDMDKDQLRQDGMRERYYDKLVPRIERLEKQIKIANLKLELKQLKGGDKMSTDPADLNQDGKVTLAEQRLYDFFLGIYNAQAGVITNTQKNSLWTILGSMVFLAFLLIFSVFTK